MMDGCHKDKTLRKHDRFRSFAYKHLGAMLTNTWTLVNRTRASLLRLL